MAHRPISSPLRISRALGLIVFLSAVLLSDPMLCAQTYPALEGYFSVVVSNSDYGRNRINSPGLQFSAGYNPQRFVRLAGEVSALYSRTDLQWQGRTIRLRDYQIVFGPEFVFRNHSRITPFARAMAGYALRHYIAGTGIYEYIPDPEGDGYWSEKNQTLVAENGLATQFGGGLDLAVGPLFSLRIIQFDYLRTHRSRGATPLLPDPSILPSLSKWQNQYRFAFGVVFRLGERGRRR